LGDRLRKLDDNVVSDSVVRSSDALGWWWNLGLGALVLVLALLAYLSEDPAAVPLGVIGATGVITGLVLREGRRRRKGQHARRFPFLR
jgi:hypothetical protein